jgi:serine/threonine protein kinase
MSQPNRCPECGAELPAGVLDGLCPKCLLAAGLEFGEGPGQAAGSGRDAPTTPNTGSFVPPQAAWLAAHFPQLEILELLGHGGMGAVYKARQPKLDRLVALKIIRPESAHDPAFAERFNREARMLARLSHPQIVAVYDFGSVEISLGEMTSTADREVYTGPHTLFFFVMEYVDGTNLRQLMQTGELVPQQALAIVPQICEALQFAHDEGVVHRDIKPENILLDKRGRVKIADFGLAKLAAGSPQEFTLTGTHQVMGTPRYMAPEQMEGSHEVDHRADIYSLGVVFYEMLTGEVPMGHFDPPSKRVEIDVRLDEVVLRTLAREPERRYQHASDVRTDVNSIVTPTGPAASIKPSIVAWPYWRPSWQAYAAYSMVFALLLHSLVAAVYGNSVLWNNTVVLATLATILVTSCLAYLIEKLRFDVRKSWRDPRNLTTLVLGFVMMLVTVLLPSPVELRDWLPSTTESFTERDERYLRILGLGLSMWTFYFTAGHVWFALGWLIRHGSLPRGATASGSSASRSKPYVETPKTNAEFRPRGVSRETEQPGASGIANSSSTAEPYPDVLRLVQNPAWGLIITGIISWVTIPLAFWIPILQDLNATQRTIFQITFGAIPLIVGTIMALAGYRMRRLEGYRLAMFAAVLPIVVLIFKLVGLSFGTLGINPADWVGAPIGLWALVVLTRSDVKSAFRRKFVAALGD